MPKSSKIKPVKLQINAKGAWKDVIHFDAASDDESDRVISAACTLAEIDGGVTFRIVTDEVTPERLMQWTKQDGWQVVRS